jgi:hypothetical protein
MGKKLNTFYSSKNLVEYRYNFSGKIWWSLFYRKIANSQDPYVALRVYIKGTKPSKLKTFLTEFLLRDPLYTVMCTSTGFVDVPKKRRSHT